MRVRPQLIASLSLFDPLWPARCVRCWPKGERRERRERLPAVRHFSTTPARSFAPRPLIAHRSRLGGLIADRCMS
jgi:hypothetical protein